MVVEMRQIRTVLRMRGPLGSRNFRLLLACDVISGIGSAVAFVAIPFAVLAIGGSARCSRRSRTTCCRGCPRSMPSAASPWHRSAWRSRARSRRPFGTSTVLLAGGAVIVLLTAAVLLVPEARQMLRKNFSKSA